MSEKNRYLDIIKNQRSSKTKKKFSGTLLDYLQIVEEDPTVTDHAHKRLYDAIVERGSATMDKSDARRRKLFNDENVKILQRTPALQGSKNPASCKGQETLAGETKAADVGRPVQASKLRRHQQENAELQS